MKHTSEKVDNKIRTLRHCRDNERLTYCSDVEQIRKKEEFLQKVKNWNWEKIFTYSSTVGLKGLTEASDGCMFSVPGEIHGMTQDQFVITVEHVKDYVHKSFKNVQDLKGLFDACSRPVITKP